MNSICKIILQLISSLRLRSGSGSSPFPERSRRELYYGKIIVNLALLLLTTLPLAALDTIDINSCNPNCVIGKNLEILEDKTNLLTIEDIRNAEDERNNNENATHKNDKGKDVALQRLYDRRLDWKKSKSDKPNFGFSSSSYWVKFHLGNNTDKPVKYFLETINF